MSTNAIEAWFSLSSCLDVTISFLNEMASNYGKDDTNLEFIIWLLANDNYPHGIRIKVQFDGVRHVVHFPKDLSNIDDIVINKRLDERIFGKDKRNLKKFILNNIDLLNEIWDDKYNNLSKSYILKRIKKVKIK